VIGSGVKTLSAGSLFNNSSVPKCRERELKKEVGF
jgi:hypothetical protein